VLCFVPRRIAIPSASLRALGPVLVDARLLVALSFIVFFIAGNFVFLTYLTPFLQSRFQLQDTALAAVLLLYGLGAVAGNLLGGRLADRLGAVNMLVIVCVVQLLVLPAMSLLELPLPMALALLAVWSVFGWSVHATQQTRLVSLDAPRAPLLLALHSSGIYLGASAGSAIAGQVLAVSNDRWLGPVGAVLTLMASAALVTVAAMTYTRQRATRSLRETAYNRTRSAMSITWQNDERRQRRHVTARCPVNSNAPARQGRLTALWLWAK
jgi:MFS transporter, DHA1 family, inner membrane transport protein